MIVVPLHWHFDPVRLRAVVEVMRERGAPRLRGTWDASEGGWWFAHEGCHRLRAALLLGLVPVMVETRWPKSAAALARARLRLRSHNFGGVVVRVTCDACGRVAFRGLAELAEPHRVQAVERAKVCAGTWVSAPKGDPFEPSPVEVDPVDHTEEFCAMPAGAPLNPRSRWWPREEKPAWICNVCGPVHMPHGFDHRTVTWACGGTSMRSPAPNRPPEPATSSVQSTSEQLSLF